MALIPLEIPAGIKSNGTDLQSAGRWLSSNLVRWVGGSLRPVGGWDVRVSSAFADPVRGMLAWRQNSGDRWLAAGSHDTLYVVSASGLVSDITPGGLATGRIDAAQNRGFGGGFFGTGLYGATRPDTGVYSEATTWALDTWGEYLIATHSDDGRIFEWALNTGTPAAVVSGAPVDNLGAFVSGERFLFALGAGGNPRRVQWSDREDNTAWTPSAENEAGDFDLQTPGQIMAGLKTRGVSLILTDMDAHSATYIGPPFVYSFDRVGTSCGLVARGAVVSTDAGTFWMGRRGFFVFDGSNVRDIPCEVTDHVFTNISTSQISKTWALANHQFGEVWWFYCSDGATEIDSYVSFNYKEGYWAVGSVSRTAGVPRGVFTTPIMAGADGTVYDHETGLNFDGALPFAESGPVSIGVGDNVMNVTRLIPDEGSQGDVTATFKTRFYPNDTERSYGPYSMGNPTSVRFVGRQVRMRVEANGLSDWRVGVMRIDAVPGGRR